MNHQAGAIWDRPAAEGGRLGVDLGPDVTDQDMSKFRSEVVALWGWTLRLASKAARGGGSA